MTRDIGNIGTKSVPVHLFRANRQRGCVTTALRITVKLRSADPSRLTCRSLTIDATLGGRVSAADALRHPGAELWRGTRSGLGSALGQATSSATLGQQH